MIDKTVRCPGGTAWRAVDIAWGADGRWRNRGPGRGRRIGGTMSQPRTTKRPANKTATKQTSGQEDHSQENHGEENGGQQDDLAAAGSAGNSWHGRSGCCAVAALPGRGRDADARPAEAPGRPGALLLNENYVHLPLKVAMHAVNPLQRLRVMRARMERLTDEDDGGRVAVPSARCRASSTRSATCTPTTCCRCRSREDRVPAVHDREVLRRGRAEHYLITRTVTGYQAPQFGRRCRGDALERYADRPRGRAQRRHVRRQQRRRQPGPRPGVADPAPAGHPGPAGRGLGDPELRRPRRLGPGTARAVEGHHEPPADDGPGRNQRGVRRDGARSGLR